MYYDDDDDDYYRNADPRDRRASVTRERRPGRPITSNRYPTGDRGDRHHTGQRYPTDQPSAETLPPAAPVPTLPPGYPYPYPPPASVPGPYIPPGYGWPALAPSMPPMPYGCPPDYGYGYRPKANMTTLGRVVRAATPFLVALLPLPTPPVPVTSQGENATDVKGLLVNEANQITYQTALAESVKRDELVFAVGNGLGMFLEKGWS